MPPETVEAIERLNAKLEERRLEARDRITAARVLQCVRVEFTAADPVEGSEVYMAIPFYVDGTTDGAEGEWCELVDRATFAVRWEDPHALDDIEIPAPACGPIVMAVLRAFVEAHEAATNESRGRS